MVFSANSSSSQPASSYLTYPPTPSPASPAYGPEPPRYRVFRIQHSPGSSKIFIPTGPPRPAGHVYSVTDISHPDHPQPILPLMTDHLSAPHHIGDLYESELIGSIASQDFDIVQAMIKGYPRPFNPQEPEPPRGESSRCELWVRAVIDMLLEDGIVKPPPPEHAATGGHQLPRHHHTAHCTHQRLHSHHPYRRHSRQSMDRNQ
ncbi:hypothetical protein FSARC_3080 [Fusarium sarcochroum]|uniref:Uncharacterized protein n=1 Tax=Fusarium sarcochroum TaxID=1208366 RepID=A0A8H4XC98_9HYPO|nr:hypothetical protein FSARC_3080 [Fusarium sarcochroum]